MPFGGRGESADRHLERGRTRSTCYDTGKHPSHDWDPVQGWDVKLWCPGTDGGHPQIPPELGETLRG